MFLNLVLDLDECLVHVFVEDLDWNLYRKCKSDPKTKDRVFRVKIGDAYCWGVKRPHLDKFLDFAFEHFRTVSVWSAGSTPYVTAAVKKIFKEKPKRVLTRDQILYDCPEDRLSYSKPLVHYFKVFPEASAEDTILVDNQHRNSKYDPENIMHVPDYDPEQRYADIAADDTTLLKLIDWFGSLEEKVDIRELDKSLAFASAYHSILKHYADNYSLIAASYVKQL